MTESTISFIPNESSWSKTFYLECSGAVKERWNFTGSDTVMPKVQLRKHPLYQITNKTLLLNDEQGLTKCPEEALKRVKQSGHLL